VCLDNCAYPSRDYEKQDQQGMAAFNKRIFNTEPLTSSPEEHTVTNGSCLLSFDNRFVFQPRKIYNFLRWEQHVSAMLHASQILTNHI
jgi:hypothetical protein